MLSIENYQQMCRMAGGRISGLSPISSEGKTQVYRAVVADYPAAKQDKQPAAHGAIGHEFKVLDGKITSYSTYRIDYKNTVGQKPYFEDDRGLPTYEDIMKEWAANLF